MSSALGNAASAALFVGATAAGVALCKLRKQKKVPKRCTPQEPCKQAFFHRLNKRMTDIKSLLCVGLDPHPRDLGAAPSAQKAFDFCRRLVDATKQHAACYKPNAAFFEAFGAPGMAQLKRLIEYIPDDIPVLLDCKRGDIGSTSEAYARAAFGTLGADAVTLSGYMGSDSIRPFSSDPTKGVFVLCKTSNPSSNELQTLQIAGAAKPERVFERVARLCGEWGENVGVVVGATDVKAVADTRASAPDVWILAPGVGAQGGDPVQALRAGVRPTGRFGMLVPVSRGISRAADPRLAARDLAATLWETAVRVRHEAAEGATGTASAPAAGAAAAKPAAAGASAAAGGDEAEDEGDSAYALAQHQRLFLNTAVDCEVLRFGDFQLKSGRQSPYFFNAGKFRSGLSLRHVGEAYAATINALSDQLDFDVLFGPAYKGIPLVAVVGVALALGAGGGAPRDIPVAFNRKEPKDHGEGGLLVGASVRGKRVLILDDVISAGTAITESVQLLRREGATPVGVVIGLDRQEVGRDGSRKAATTQVREQLGMPVHAVVTLNDLLAYVQSTAAAATGERQQQWHQHAAAIEAYREEYGADE